MSASAISHRPYRGGRKPKGIRAKRLTITAQLKASYVIDAQKAWPSCAKESRPHVRLNRKETPGDQTEAHNWLSSKLAYADRRRGQSLPYALSLVRNAKGSAHLVGL
jgi:hypothetical protein